MTATPGLSSTVLNAGDSVTVTVQTAASPQVTAVEVDLIDSRNGSFLVGDAVTNPYNDLSTTDNVNWTGTFTVSPLATTDTFTVQVCTEASSVDIVTCYYLDIGDASAVYRRATQQGSGSPFLDISAIGVRSANVTAAGGTTIYYVSTGSTCCWSADPYLEITPTTSSPSDFALARNDDYQSGASTSYDSGLRVALQSGQSYYIRVIDMWSIGGDYGLFVTTAPLTGYSTTGYPGPSDPFEPDNAAGQAQAITIGTSNTQHTFYPVGETDWQVFTAP